MGHMNLNPTLSQIHCISWWFSVAFFHLIGNQPVEPSKKKTQRKNILRSWYYSDLVVESLGEGY